MKKLTIVLHPFFFAVYPVIRYYAHNITEVQPNVILRPLAVVLLACVVMVGFFHLVMRDWQRGGLAITLIWIMFSSYGHVYSWLVGFTQPRADVLAAVWASVLILGLWGIGRVMRGGAAPLTVFLNVTGGAALLLASVNIGVFALQSLNYRRAASQTQPVGLPAAPTASGLAARPDIYYIILDGYARRDVQETIYDIHEFPLHDFLAEKGFYVAENAHSNYAYTAQSLSASLNMDYLDRLVQVDPNLNSREPLQDLIEENQVVQTLREQGYTIVAFESGYPPTEIQSADVFVRSSLPGEMNDFEQGLLSGSVMILSVDRMMPVIYRQKILNRFDLIATQAAVEGPKFVFIHLTVPHPPFLFDEQGRPVVITGQQDADGRDVGVNKMDGSFFIGGREPYIRGYRGQLMFVNHKIMAAIDAILAQSKTRPVIILQSDHGPGAYLKLSSIEETCVGERFSILNAYYLPEEAQQDLYPDITPVNSFRLLFNHLFGAQYALLPDRSYFNVEDRPFDPAEVTHRLNEPCR